MRAGDEARLLEIFSDPTVARWWGEPSKSVADTMQADEGESHFLIDERGHHRLTIDPAAHNTNAIKAYERVGFRPVGVMRKYERGPDGEWHDGLLMDMLAEELRD